MNRMMNIFYGGKTLKKWSEKHMNLFLLEFGLSLASLLLTIVVCSVA